MEQEKYLISSYDKENCEKITYGDFIKKMTNRLAENNLYRKSEKVLKLLCTGCNNN